MSYRVPHVTIHGDTRNVFNKPLISAYSYLLATGDAVVETHEDLSGIWPSEDNKERHRAARIAHEDALMFDHDAKVLMAEAVRIEWLETREKTFDECLQACEGFHIDEAILRRVVARQDAVKGFMAKLDGLDSAPVEPGYFISPDPYEMDYYPGNQEQALNAFARYSGYRDFAHRASTLGKSLEESKCGLRIIIA